jgi:putative endonuclease
MFYVYVLKSKKDSRHYIGFTVDLKNRYKEHSSGKVKSTFFRRPLELIYYECYKDRKIAQKREKQIKAGKSHMALIKRLSGG